MMTKTTKTFDCVRMKRQGAERLRQRLAGLTEQQQLDYWRQRNAQFQRDQAALLRNRGRGDHGNTDSDAS